MPSQFLRHFLLFPALATFASAFQVDETIPSGTFTTESHLPSDSGNFIRSENGKVNFIQNNTWVAYDDFDFGVGATHFWVEGGSPNSGGTLEIWTRTDNGLLENGPNGGQLIGSIAITNTGGFNTFREFSTNLTPAVSGVRDLFFKFTGGGGFLFDVRSFRFQTIAPGTKVPGSEFDSGSFDAESHPGVAPVTKSGSSITAIEGGSWVGYTAFDFGAETNHFMIEGASPGKGGTIELRLGSAQGAVIGTVDIPHTGSFAHFRPFSCVLTRTTSGVHDLYLNFVDSRNTGGILFYTREFIFGREDSKVMLPYFADEDADQLPKIIEYATGMHPESKDNLPLKMAVKNAAAEGGHHDVEVRLRADPSLVSKLLVSHNLSQWDEVAITFLNGAWQTNNTNVTISEVIPQNDGLHLIRLNDSRTQTRLFTRLSVTTAEGDIHVYPPVPDVNATPTYKSPYYTFSIQKVSALNAPLKQNATNWENPFAWFTRCVDYVPNRTDDTAYFSSFIGSWSHTYCNFEMDPHTPIVVKITRLNKPGAPSGPITTAAAHPAHKVISCEVIGGDVYVTMSHPALVAIDIDGQLDSRDAPRAIPDVWGSAPFPYRNEMNGAHGVTIFANPFIEDKPVLNDSSVFYVQPGTLPPSDGPWSTLYFLPGVHKLSVDGSGNEREWTITDPLFLRNNKSYYIPGDAIVYGNLSDYDDNLDSTNVRVFGHGTISGEKIPHWQDFKNLPPELKEFDVGKNKDILIGSEHKKLRMLQLTKARGCSYEGVTIANPAEHGTYIQVASGDYTPNTIKWLKNIAWRVNNDGGGVTENGYVEDCFFRHQDDALYIRGVAIRRCVLWSDVNGTPFRCSFITSDQDSNFPTTRPQDLIVEDCDVIYARGVFAFSTAKAFGVIGTPGSFDSTKTFADGAVNTGQHISFRNIRISDPRPQRNLFGFEANGDPLDPQVLPWAGLRFENIDYQHPQTWGWKSSLLGNGTAVIRYWTFDQVSIGGVPLDAGYLYDPAKFNTNFVSDMIFK